MACIQIPRVLLTADFLEAECIWSALNWMLLLAFLTGETAIFSFFIAFTQICAFFFFTATLILLGIWKDWIDNYFVPNKQVLSSAFRYILCESQSLMPCWYTEVIAVSKITFGLILHFSIAIASSQVRWLTYYLFPWATVLQLCPDNCAGIYSTYIWV